ncbi:MAG: S9 family peptidase, partial [Myxococcota bacterium]
VSGVAVSRRDGRLLGVRYVSEKLERVYFDEDSRKRWEGVERALPGRLNLILGSISEGRQKLIRSSADTAPPAYYLYDEGEPAITPLFELYPELSDVKHAPMQPISYVARDGLEVPGYLTVPVDGTRAPFPLIVMPHGGPWARDVWGWDPIVQFLVSRGFAVLQPNFRGSTGYGQAYFERGGGRWGLEMQDDVTDGARWAIQEGIADPARVGIFGISYGGYAALRAMQMEPELFRAGASYAAVTDLPELLEDASRYEFWIAELESLVGRRREDRIKLAKASPARGAHEIRGAILIGHGSEDSRVQVSQARLMVDALRRAGREVEAYVYDGEDHSFIDERNQIEFFTRLASFFERQLGPPSRTSSPRGGVGPGRELPGQRRKGSSFSRRREGARRVLDWMTANQGGPSPRKSGDGSHASKRSASFFQTERSTS